jgi:hypothetical protein
MNKIIEYITLITSIFGLLLAFASLWNISKNILKRLAIIQTRLDSLKGLIICYGGRVSDIERHLHTNDGYHIRTSDTKIEESFLGQYADSDTGF